MPNPNNSILKTENVQQNTKLLPAAVPRPANKIDQLVKNSVHALTRGDRSTPATLAKFAYDVAFNPPNTFSAQKVNPDLQAQKENVFLRNLGRTALTSATVTTATYIGGDLPRMLQVNGWDWKPILNLLTEGITSHKESLMRLLKALGYSHSVGAVKTTFYLQKEPVHDYIHSYISSGTVKTNSHHTQQTEAANGSTATEFSKKPSAIAPVLLTTGVLTLADLFTTGFLQFSKMSNLLGVPLKLTKLSINDYLNLSMLGFGPRFAKTFSAALFNILSLTHIKPETDKLFAENDYGNNASYMLSTLLAALSASVFTTPAQIFYNETVKSIDPKTMQSSSVVKIFIDTLQAELKKNPNLLKVMSGLNSKFSSGYWINVSQALMVIGIINAFILHYEKIDRQAKMIEADVSVDLNKFIEKEAEVYNASHTNKATFFKRSYSEGSVVRVEKSTSEKDHAQPEDSHLFSCGNLFAR